MTNRIQHLLDERAESPRNGEYFVVAGEFGQVFVARETAYRLRILLSRVFTPRWIEFRTITGSVMLVRTRHVHTIVESHDRAARRGTSVLARPRGGRKHRPASLGPGLISHPARAPTRARRHEASTSAPNRAGVP